MKLDNAELRDRLASEYVLGTLHGAARRRFQRLMNDDARVRAAVESWERQLMPMAAPLAAPMPSAELWDRVAARVAPARGPQRSAFARWLERWFEPRMLGSLAAGLFVGVGIALVAPQMLREPPVGDSPRETQLPQSYAGILSDANGHPAMLISSLRHGRIVDVKVLRPIGVGQGDELRLWALAPGSAPVPLGVVPAQGKGRVELPATSEQLLSKVTELAVSAGRKGDASAPSAFVLRGPCAKFW